MLDFEMPIREQSALILHNILGNPPIAQTAAFGQYGVSFSGCLAMFGGSPEIHYLFVDGGSLRGRLENLSREFFQNRSFYINFPNLVLGYTKVFYYDAIPVRNDGEDEAAYNARIRPQRELLDSAACVDRIHVYEGDARRRRKVGLQHKKADVMIAVDMLTHTFRHNMHQTTLLTGDNDFKPLIDALGARGNVRNALVPVR
jgi:hypothetical protein